MWGWGEETTPHLLRVHLVWGTSLFSSLDLPNQPGVHLLSLTTGMSPHSREGERVGEGHKQRHSSSSKCLLSSPTHSSRAGKFYFLWVRGMRWGEEEELAQPVLIQIDYFCQELTFEGQKLWIINNYVCSFFLEAVKLEYLVCLGLEDSHGLCVFACVYEGAC